jgi:hypothetical protein
MQLRHLYVFVIDTGVAELCNYDIGETLFSLGTLLFGLQFLSWTTERIRLNLIIELVLGSSEIVF